MKLAVIHLIALGLGLMRLEAAPAAPAHSAAPTPFPPPDFGPNVLVLDPSLPDLQQRLDAVFARQEASQFGPGRYAYLFKPGQYRLDVQVGFYTQVLGLGRSPDEVAITGAVRCKANWMAHHNATCNFWRCAENLSVTPTLDHNVNVWAVSQATALRRVHLRGNLNLWDGGWSSGGFIADSVVDGQVDSGSQQQWFSRNTAFGAWKGGNWNMVFVGTVNPPTGTWPAAPYTVIERTPAIREKPFLFLDKAGRYFVMVPPLQRAGSRGPSWFGASAQGTPISLKRFHLAQPGRDDAPRLNAALRRGKHLLFTPGLYPLSETLRITRPGTIVLGLGYPTLQIDRGQKGIVVADVDGVKIAGLLLEAGPDPSPTLVEIGSPGTRISHARDPIVLHDLFCRAGGARLGRAICLLAIHAHDVIADNLWLWRADHGEGVGWTANENQHGLLVRGDRVIIYGLFVEHGQNYQTVWEGEDGRVFFYQSEMPYDPPSQDAWRHGDVNGFASYKVGSDVTRHEAWGLGVYCVFQRAPVVADNAIEAPSAPGIRLRHLVAIRLTGQPGSGIRHVISGTGASVITNQKAIVDRWPPSP